MINSENIEGYVYEHELVIKKVQNKESTNFGKNFISGKLKVATDEAGLNVIETHYTYIPETTKNGNKNGTYTTLEKIVNENPTWSAKGKENALKVRLTPSLDVYDFVSPRDESLVTAKRNEGGFASVISTLNEEEKKRNTFKVDMIITSATRVPADEEKNIEEKLVLRGAVFNFRKALLPVDLVVKNPEGMDYFESLGATANTPVFTCVWGRIMNSIVKTVTKTESAFGEAAVDEKEKETKEWVVTGANTVPYDFDEDSTTTLTPEELKKAMQDREVHLAEVRKNHEDWVASKNAGGVTTPGASTVTAAQGGFNF